MGAFQGAIMLQPICGYVMDVIGLKFGFAIFAVAWSFISMAHGLAGSWTALFWLRGFLGLAEGSANPAGMKATSEWFPAQERGLAGGVFNIGASFGSMLAPPLVAWAILSYNWQAAFVLTGALGLVWVVLWLWLYQPPAKHPALSDEERRHILSGQEQHLQSDGTRPSIGRILAQRNFWGIALPRFLADPTWGTLTFWLPLYLTTVRHFDLKQIALFAWLPFLAADLGCLHRRDDQPDAPEVLRHQPHQRKARSLHGRRVPDGRASPLSASSRAPTRLSRCSAWRASRIRRSR